MDSSILALLVLLLGWGADRLWGDPEKMPHPIVGYGKCIAWGEKRWNKGKRRGVKGACLTLLLVGGVYLLASFFFALLKDISVYLYLPIAAFFVFTSLSGKTLI